MRNSSKIALHLFIIQCFWSLQSHGKIEPSSCDTLYCHSLGANKDQKEEFSQFMYGSNHSFDYPDAKKPTGYNINTLIYHTIKTIWPKKIINRNEMNLGQKPDIEATIEQIETKQPSVIVASSRGPQAVTKALAQYNPASPRLVIFDEMPSDKRNVVAQLRYTYGLQFPVTEIELDRVLKFFFPAYEIGSVSSVNDIPKIKNKELVVVLTHAKKGNMYHFPSATQKSYLAFVKAGFKDVYLFATEHGSQNPSPTDELLGRQVVNSVKKLHGLPFDTEFGILTEQDLQKYKPCVESIEHLITIDQEQLEANYAAKIKQYNECNKQYKKWNP